MSKDSLVRLIGFPATLIHSDPMVLDRWIFLRRYLPRVPAGNKTLLEIGCGSGAFTIGAALRGYQSTGVTWDEETRHTAARRARICGACGADFHLQDARRLGAVSEFREAFDVVVCCETIEHVIDDQRLMSEMAHCLKPGGRLLLTTPNLNFRSIGGDEGPFYEIEDGRHIRQGYDPDDLARLCSGAGLRPLVIGYCSGYLSQKGSILLRILSLIHPLFGWLALLPLRLLPPLLDGIIARISGWPGYSITLVAARDAGYSSSDGL